MDKEGLRIMEKFFSQEKCDRCGAKMTGLRTMSRFTKECICTACAEAERSRPDYAAAVEADLAEVKKGNREFEGIGLG